MGKYAQFVMGPAGSGKSTYCYTMYKHCNDIKRKINIINLDPAAEDIKYPISADIRKYITVEEIMDKTNFGPNGGLMEAMKKFMNESCWISDLIYNDDHEDTYIIFDCPGQIELYSHNTECFPNFIQKLKENFSFELCCVYLIDSLFVVTTPYKFLSGCLMSLCALVHLYLPHVTILSKYDLLNDDLKKIVEERYLDPDFELYFPYLLEKKKINSFHNELCQAICELLDDYRYIDYIPLNIKNSQSISHVLECIDSTLGYFNDPQ